jgi:hypothetical protein
MTLTETQAAAAGPLRPSWQQPSHPSTIKVRSSASLASNSDAKASSFHLTATADCDIPAGTLLAKNTSTTLASTKDYSTVQVSRTQHISLNSDLLYCNHSCDPNVRFVTSTLAAIPTKDSSVQPGEPISGAIEVWSLRDISQGEELRFFYPSTEWEMAQPFDCCCGAKECVGKIDGAKNLPTDLLRKYWLSSHIESLLAERDTLVKG